MHRHALALFAALAVAIPPSARAQQSMTLDTAVRLEIIDCASGGSADAGAGLGNTLPAGEYVFRVKTDDTWVCLAATCATGGEWWPASTVVELNFSAAQLISCRSAGSTGDIVFTRVR